MCIRQVLYHQGSVGSRRAGTVCTALSRYGKSSHQHNSRCRRHRGSVLHLFLSSRIPWRGHAGRGRRSRCLGRAPCHQRSSCKPRGRHHCSGAEERAARLVRLKQPTDCAACRCKLGACSWANQLPCMPSSTSMHLRHASAGRPSRHLSSHHASQLGSRLVHAWQALADRLYPTPCGSVSPCPGMHALHWLSSSHSAQLDTPHGTQAFASSSSRKPLAHSVHLLTASLLQCIEEVGAERVTAWCFATGNDAI